MLVLALKGCDINMHVTFLYFSTRFPSFFGFAVGRTLGYPWLLFPTPFDVPVEGFVTKIPSYQTNKKDRHVFFLNSQKFHCKKVWRIPFTARTSIRVGTSGFANRFDQTEVILSPRRDFWLVHRPPDQWGWWDLVSGRRGDFGYIWKIFQPLLGRIERFAFLGGHLLADILVPVQWLHLEGPEAYRAGQQYLLHRGFFILNADLHHRLGCFCSCKCEWVDWKHSTDFAENQKREISPLNSLYMAAVMMQTLSRRQ